MLANLFTMFDRIACISLTRRADRFEQFRSSLSFVSPGTAIERFAAVDGSSLQPPAWWRGGKGAWGCMQSHIRVLEDALQDDVRSLLVFEDDAFFDQGIGAQIEAFFAAVPSDWDGIMLGGRHIRRPFEISDLVVRVHGARRTHALGYKRDYMKAIYCHLNDYTSHSRMRSHHIDHRLSKLHRDLSFRVYAPKLWLVGQQAGISDIQRRYVPERIWNRR